MTFRQFETGGTAEQNEELNMKRRWMKPVIETAKQPAPSLPFGRGVRALTRIAADQTLRRKVRRA